jgi:flagellar hook assembly protein FlgD
MSNRIPGDFSLHQNYPNPFNPSTIIQYALPGPGHVRLVIYDLLGRSIKTLMDAPQPTGQFQAIWDGTNERNQSVAAGVYFCYLRISPSTGSVAGGGLTGSASTRAGDSSGQEFVKVIKLVLIK